jgi:hypothetical protein
MMRKNGRQRLRRLKVSCSPRLVARLRQQFERARDVDDRAGGHAGITGRGIEFGMTTTAGISTVAISGVRWRKCDEPLAALMWSAKLARGHVSDHTLRKRLR